MKTVIALVLWVGATFSSAQAQITDSNVDQDVRYVTRTITRGTILKMRLIFFNSRSFRLKVIENTYPSMEAAFRANQCVGGVNGGFFKPDKKPLGLMIHSGQRTGTFSTTSTLLSGVVYSDPEGNYLLRRAAFKDHAGITDLLQSGPYLVENGTAVRGLSTEPARRRTFILSDYQGNWVLGQTDAVSLARLAETLADKTSFPEFTVNRALNLDGGSSCGIFFDRGAGKKAVNVSPYKHVSNYLGIVPR